MFNLAKLNKARIFTMQIGELRSVARNLHDGVFTVAKTET